jgi:hypothetical protein
MADYLELHEEDHEDLVCATHTSSQACFNSGEPGASVAGREASGAVPRPSLATCHILYSFAVWSPSEIPFSLTGEWYNPAHGREIALAKDNR